MSSPEQIEIDEMGPVDYVLLEWPKGRPHGEVAPMIIDLVDRGLIRILDIAFVAKDANGAMTVLDLDHLDESAGAFRDFEGASSGLLDREDLEEAATVLADDSAAAVIIWENRWLAPVAVALRQSGAQLAASGRVPIQALLASIESLEPTAS